MNEGNVLFNNVFNTFYLVIWHKTCGKDTYKEWRNERNVLFNNILNTFYLWLYGV